MTLGAGFHANRPGEKELYELCAFLDMASYKDRLPEPHHEMPLGSPYSGIGTLSALNVNDEYLQEMLK